MPKSTFPACLGDWYTKARENEPPYGAVRVKHCGRGVHLLTAVMDWKDPRHPTSEVVNAGKLSFRVTNQARTGTPTLRVWSEATRQRIEFVGEEPDTRVWVPGRSVEEDCSFAEGSFNFRVVRPGDEDVHTCAVPVSGQLETGQEKKPAQSRFTALLASPRDLEHVRRATQGRATPERWDVFLSYNSQDRSFIRTLKQELEAKDLRVWLDEEELQPGVSTLASMESGLTSSNSVVVAVGKEGLGTWEQEEVQAALRQAQRDGRPVIGVLIPGAEHDELPVFLGNRTFVDLRPGITAEGISRLVWGITGRKG